MSTAPRVEWKVGLFVLVSLVLLGGLILRFSKGASLFEKTYNLFLRTENVGMIRAGAGVFISGVPVGNVTSIGLLEGNRGVLIEAQILERFKIQTNALFVIEQVSFLGDQVISVIPGDGRAPLLKDGDMVHVEQPFSLQDVARAGNTLINHLNEAVLKLNDAVERVDRTLLAEETLTDLSEAVRNVRKMSERAVSVVDSVDEIVQSNSPALSASVTNLVIFSDELNRVSEELRMTLATNRAGIARAVENMESASARFDRMLENVERGEGVVGSLLNDRQLESDLELTVQNLSTLSSNLNKYGLLYKPKRPRNIPPPIYPGKNPFD